MNIPRSYRPGAGIALLVGENADLKAVPRWTVRMEGHDPRRREGKTMDTNLLILIVVLVLLFGGGGFYWSRRR